MAPQRNMFLRQRENTAIMEETFSTLSVPRCCNQDQLAVAFRSPCGSGFEHLHRSPASRTRRRKGNPVIGCITGSPCSWRDINTGPAPPGWGSLESETVKYGHESRGGIPTLARSSKNYERQTRPRVREVAPSQQNATVCQ
jgi:hypothetical protein